ncbi:MAG: SIMPL domain-containing protein [Candidatus Weimeria sp.]
MKRKIETAAVTALVIIGVIALCIVIVTCIGRGRDVTVTKTGTATHKVTVSGEGKIYVKPDKASFRISVTGLGDTLNEATGNADATSRVIYAKLKDAGIKKKDIKTEDISGSVKYDYIEAENDGYDSYVMITVEGALKPAKKAYSVIAAMDSDDTVTINTMDFTTSVSDEDAVYKKAVKDAMKNAREKADAIAEESGMKVKGVLNVSEYSYDDTAYEPEGSYSNVTENSTSDSTAVSAPSSSVSVEEGRKEKTAEIKVTFAMR